MESQDIHRVLITGIAGSGGSYLAEHIRRLHPDVQVHGLARWHSASMNSTLSALRGQVAVHECDLNDFGSVLSALAAAQPDIIFHLASHANVQASFTTPLAVMQNNIMGTANLFEAVRHSGLTPIIQHCSTSEVYGQVAPDQTPIRENCPLQPASPYAVSKVTQDLLARTYFLNWGSRIIRTRMFSYINPRRADLFATSFARQVARIELGLQRELNHGNLDSVRTMIDVRDAMEAYWVAALKCEPGEVYNIGGTATLTVGECLQRLVQMAHKPIPMRLDPTLLRPTDVTLQIPCTDKFTGRTGWRPTYSLDQSLEFLLAECRRQVRIESASARGGASSA